MGIAFNQCTFAGYMTKDPELSAYDSRSIAKFSVGVNGYKEGDVYFQECVAWGKVAETIGTFLKKGSAVLVTGEMKEDRWEHEGKKYFKTVLTVLRCQFLDKKATGGGSNDDPPF